MPLIELPDGGFILDERDELRPRYSSKVPDDAINDDDKSKQYETVKRGADNGKK
ncbi:MAG: hypothetical protein LUH14_03435 [Clostridiaceae bacterium]|nr:hypothetical protein [Clostridiaceae bacterium]